MSTSTFFRLCTRAPRTEIHSWAINEDWGALTRTQALWQSTIVARRCREAQPQLGIRDWGFGIRMSSGFGIRVEFGLRIRGSGFASGVSQPRFGAIQSAVPSRKPRVPGPEPRPESRESRIPNPES